MSAYVLVNMNVHDPSFLDEYLPKLLPLLEKHGGRRLAGGGKAEVLEGDVTLPSAVVVLEFPSMEKAKAWHGDAEYAPLIKLRQSGSSAEAVLVEGL